MGSCLTKIYYNMGYMSPYNEMDYVDCEKGLKVREYRYDSDNESTGSIVIHDGEFDSFLYGKTK